VRHLLVTNDFPPKVGGIQSYLWELWRRLPSRSFSVLTIDHPDSAAFDASQPFGIERLATRMLLPSPGLARHIRRRCQETGADLVVLDPALPLGLVGPSLGLPYALVIHGAEVTVPSRLPAARETLAWVLRHASAVIAAGGYPETQARRAAGSRMPPVTVIPPGVDAARFRPLDDTERARIRAELKLPTDGRLVLSVSRLVPRKGMDVLIDAASRLGATRPDLTVAIAGSGRDSSRLDRLIGGSAAPVHLLGRVPDEDLPRLYASADVFAMLCRDRWAGLEQEGFGIVFLEAAACAVPQVAGDSGGAAEAVVEGATGLVIRRPRDAEQAARSLASLLDDEGLRRRLGRAARSRVEASFDYQTLATRLELALGKLGD
jgi:phosphatidylinositol alpha-1,6-mannosyltransferase